MRKTEPFIPKYPPLLSGLLYSLPALFALLLFAGIQFATNLPSWFWWFPLFAGLAAAILPFFHIRKVEFRELLVFRRFLLPPVYLEHREIDRIEAGILYTTRGTLRLGRPYNQVELEERMQRWKADHLLRQARAAGQDQPAQVFPGRGYMSYGFAWGLLFGLLALLARPGWLPSDPRWLFGIAFLAAYLLLGWILPARL